MRICMLDKPCDSSLKQQNTKANEGELFFSIQPHHNVKLRFNDGVIVSCSLLYKTFLSGKQLF